MRTSTCFLFCLLSASLSPLLAHASGEESIGKTVDAGTLLVVVNGRLKGDETYQMKKQGDSLVLRSKIQYPDPLSGHNLSLSGDVRVRAGNFESIEVEGYTPSGFRTRKTVTIEQSEIVVTGSEGVTREKTPARFFAITGSLPATMHIPLLQYWITHGRPKTLRIFPEGNVSIQFRGEDTVDVSGEKRSLIGTRCLG